MMMTPITMKKTLLKIMKMMIIDILNIIMIT